MAQQVILQIDISEYFKAFFPLIKRPRKCSLLWIMIRILDSWISNVSLVRVHHVLIFCLFFKLKLFWNLDFIIIFYRYFHVNICYKFYKISSVNECYPLFEKTFITLPQRHPWGLGFEYVTCDLWPMTSALIPLVRPQVLPTFLKVIVVRKYTYYILIVYSFKNPRHSNSRKVDRT